MVCGGVANDDARIGKRSAVRRRVPAAGRAGPVPGPGRGHRGAESDGAEASGRPLPRYTALPGGPHAPEPWLLGSSPQSAVWAAELVLPYAFADFIIPDGAAAVAHYRTYFQPSAALPEPRVAVAVWAICADTDAEARELAASFRMMITLLHRGRLIRVPPVETALKFLADEGRSAASLPRDRRLIAGSPLTVRGGIQAVAAEYQADEVLIVNILHNHA